MKIAVLHGAIINAGDFLIKNRAISLLKYFYPDSEIVEYYRNQSLEEKLPEINACDLPVDLDIVMDFIQGWHQLQMI